MKRLKIWSIMGLAVIMMLLVASCGGDSDDNDKGSSNGGAVKYNRIAKIVTEEGSSIYEATYSYDSQNRVVKIVTIENSNSPSETVRTYQYGETLIIAKAEVDGKWSNGESYSRSETHTYTVVDGLIVKDKETKSGGSRNTTYTYDSNGYMETISEEGSEGATKMLVWNNGNLTHIDIDALNYTVRTYVYSSTPWLNELGFYLIPNTDGCLGGLGYYGRMPKMLPSKIDDESILYTVVGGLVTKVVTTFTEKGKTQTSVSNITWE